MSRLLLVSGLVLGPVLLTAAVGASAPPQAPTPRVVPIDELVRQLNSEKFAEREAATKRLGAMAIDPPPQLLVATKSGSPELREQARKVSEAMRRNVATTRLPRGEAFTRRGQVDLFVAATAAWDLKADDPRLWDPAVDLGRVLLYKGKMTGPRTPSGCPSSFKDYAALKRVVNLSFTRLNGPYKQRSQPEDGITLYKGGIQSCGVAADQAIQYGVVASRGDVHITSGISKSVVFANGNISAASISDSVVVCDGDVEVGPLTAALVIARGNITAKRGASASTLVAGGKITLHSQEKRNLEDGHFIVVEEKEPKPLGFITFFELSAVGLEVRAADKAVTVAKVTAGSASERAGLKAGDAIVDVGGKKPADTESLRRLLRDALAVGDAAVKLRRGDRTITAKLSLPE